MYTYLDRHVCTEPMDLQCTEEGKSILVRDYVQYILHLYHIVPSKRLHICNLCRLEMVHSHNDLYAIKYTRKM